MDRTAGWTPVKNCPENTSTAPSTPSGKRYQSVRKPTGTSISSEPQPCLPSCPSTPAAASADFEFGSPQMAEDTGATPWRDDNIYIADLAAHSASSFVTSLQPPRGFNRPPCRPCYPVPVRPPHLSAGGGMRPPMPRPAYVAYVPDRFASLTYQVSEGFSSRQSSPDRPSHQAQSSAQPFVSTIQPFALPAQPLSVPAQPLPTLTQPSYASAVRRPSASIQDPSSSQAARLPPSADHRWDLAEELTPNEANRSQRTQTIRRADYGTTPSSLVAQLISQFPGHSEASLLDCVSRDVNERRRFYIVYRDLAAKRRVAGAGFRLGSLTIKPESDYTAAFIPYPPHFCDEVSMRRLLYPFGTVKSDSFQRTPGGTRIGGYTFTIELHQGRALPASITYHGVEFHVKLKDAPRFCSYCRRYGHTVGACRTKKADMAARQAEREDLRHQQQQQQRLEREQHLQQQQLPPEHQQHQDQPSQQQQQHNQQQPHQQPQQQQQQQQEQRQLQDPRLVPSRQLPPQQQQQMPPPAMPIASGDPADDPDDDDRGSHHTASPPTTPEKEQDRDIAMEEEAVSQQTKRPPRPSSTLAEGASPPPKRQTTTPAAPLHGDDPPPQSEAKPPDPPDALASEHTDVKYTIHFSFVSIKKVTKRALQAHFREKIPHVTPAVDYAATVRAEGGKHHVRIHTTSDRYEEFRGELQAMRRTEKPWQITALKDGQALVPCGKKQ